MGDGKMQEFYADPAREMRTAKRIAYAVVLVFVITVLPLYVFVFRLSPLELSVALGPALLTFFAVEMASRWEYRMRRRHAYPHLLGYRLPAPPPLRPGRGGGGGPLSQPAPPG